MQTPSVSQPLQFGVYLYSLKKEGNHVGRVVFVDGRLFIQNDRPGGQVQAFPMQQSRRHKLTPEERAFAESHYPGTPPAQMPARVKGNPVYRLLWRLSR